MSEIKTKRFKRRLDGTVLSNKNNKTIVVNVVRKFKHKTYNKFISQTKKYHAHDENNQAQVGDKVIIMESRPYSKKKTWMLWKINNSLVTELS